MLMILNLLRERFKITALICRLMTGASSKRQVPECVILCGDACYSTEPRYSHMSLGSVKITSQ